MSKISGLLVENFKKIIRVNITPSSNMVVIGGKNKQGKTSILDSIWLAILGLTKEMRNQTQLIRKGCQEARIEVSTDDQLKIIRTFRREEDGEITTKLKIVTSQNATFPHPQAVLDALYARLAFDPSEFAAMKPKEQFDVCRQFVPGIDFDAIAEADEADRKRRLAIGQAADIQRGAAAAIVVPDDTPEEEIPIETLTQKLQEAGEENQQVTLRRSNREKLQREIEDLRAAVATTDHAIEDAIQKAGLDRDAIIKRENDTITRLEEQIEALRRETQACLDRISTAHDDFKTRGQDIEKQCREKQAASRKLLESKEQILSTAPELPKLHDLDEIQQSIQQAMLINKNVARLQEKIRHQQTTKKLDDQYEDLTKQIEKRQADKRAKIAAANMPVPEISFGDECILLNGLPFSQASDMEKLHTGARLSAALNPKLRVMRIRRGQDYDADSLRRLEDLANEMDMQIWIERPSIGQEEVGFILQDGQLVKSHGEQVEEAIS